MGCALADARTQSLTVDDFFYFFLQLRKPRIRAVVDRLCKLHPEMTREQLAQRLIDSSANLSLVAGSLVGAERTIPSARGWNTLASPRGAAPLRWLR